MIKLPLKLKNTPSIKDYSITNMLLDEEDLAKFGKLN